MKRCYNVSCDDATYSIGVVASSIREAKKLGAPIIMEEWECEWIEINVKWNRKAKIDDLEIGYIFYPDEMDTIDGIKRGVYGYAKEFPCPKCKCDGDIELRGNGEVMCDNCWDEVESKEEKQ